MRARSTIATLWNRCITSPTLSPYGALQLLILTPLSWLYFIGFHLARIVAPRPRSCGVPVISVGNLTVGGSGKTPIVKYLISELSNRGLRVGVVGSGYGQKTSATCLHIPNDQTPIDVSLFGDEMVELVDRHPNISVAVGESKRKAVHALAESNACDVIIVDDGFQSLSLYRNFDIVAINVATPSRLWRLFLAGIMRESFSALCRTDSVVTVNADLATAADAEHIRKRLSASGVKQDRIVDFVATYNWELVHGADTLERQSVPAGAIFVVCGLARNDLFKEALSRRGIHARETFEFADHFAYDSAAVAPVVSALNAVDVSCLVTTAKDWTKLRTFRWPRPVWILRQDVRPSDGGTLMSRIFATVSSARRTQPTEDHS